MITDKSVRFLEKRGSGLLRLKLEKMYDRDFGAGKKVRLGGDSSLMRVWFRGVPLCTCSFQVSHFAQIYQSYSISLVFKLSNLTITEIKFDVVQISELPIQTTFLVPCVASVPEQRTFFSILARHKLEQNKAKHREICAQPE